MTERHVVGAIGGMSSSADRRMWNALFLAEGWNAFFDHYPAGVDDIPLRLSEMFLHGRAGYIVGPPLERAIMSQLDSLDELAAREGKVNTVANDGGLLRGFWVPEDGARELLRARSRLWFGVFPSDAAIDRALEARAG